MEYFERNTAALAAEEKALEKQANEWGNSAPMLYLQPGSTMVRILPPYSEQGVFFRQVVKHRVQVGNSAEIFACPAALGDACAVCQKGEELMATKDEAQMKLAKDSLRPRNQFLYNVLVKSGPADRKGNVPEFGKVYVMETGVMVHRQIISLDQDPATGWANITDAQAGVNLIIKRTGQGLKTEYEVNPHGLGRTDLFQDCAALGIDPNTIALINLDEVYTPPSAEEVEAIATKAGTGSFGAAPTPRPALQTVSPAAAAVAPTAPASAAPASVAAPTPQPAPQALPVAVAQAAPAPVVAVQPGTAAPVAAPVVPQPPAVPAPPTE